MKMKKIAVACSAAVMGLSSLGMSSAALADDMGLSFSANVALTSNYVFRGLTLSDEDPALQGGFDAEHTSGLYAGVWGSGIDQVAGAETELDVYIGWTGEFGPVGVDVGVLEYMYPGSSPDADYTEFYIGASGEIGPVGVGVTYYDADEFSDQSTWEFSGEVPVGMFTLAAVYGTNDFDSTGDDYDWWSLGASTELGGFGFDLTFSDTDGVAGGDEDQVAFTISKSL